MSGALLMSMSLTSCSGENTTGVDTETTANEVDGELNNPNGGAMTNDNISPLDTANGGAGANSGTGSGMNSAGGNSNSATGNDTARTTTPSTDNGY